MACNNTSDSSVATKFPLCVSHRHPGDNIERLRNKTNAEISCGQTSKQEFGRRMKGRHLVEGNEDKNIAKNCSNGQKNVER